MLKGMNRTGVGETDEAFREPITGCSNGRLVELNASRAARQGASVRERLLCNI